MQAFHVVSEGVSRGTQEVLFILPLRLSRGAEGIFGTRRKIMFSAISLGLEIEEFGVLSA